MKEVKAANNAQDPHVLHESKTAMAEIIRSIQELDSVFKGQSFRKSISSTCHIACLIHDQFTSETISDLSVTFSSCIKRILMKLGKLIVASAVLNSAWYISDTQDNARYQAGQVSLALKSFETMQSTFLSNDSSKISKDVFTALLTENVMSELRNGSDFLSNQVFLSISGLQDLSQANETDIFSKIGLFIQALGVFISYAETVQTLFVNKQADLLSQKIMNCIKFIKGRETTETQKKMLLIPNNVVKIKSLIREMVDVFDEILCGKLNNPLKFHEILSVRESDPSCLGLKDLHLSCLEWARPEKTEDKADIMMSVYSTNDKRKRSSHISQDKDDNVTTVSFVRFSY